MKLPLPDTVSSEQDLKSLILEIRDYARWAGQAAVKKKLHSKHAPPEAPELSAGAKQLVKEWTAKEPLSRESMDKLITALEEAGSKAPTVTITLAAPPTSGLKKTLVAWCRENVSPNVLVAFDFNSTLLGGMVVRHGSHIFDWSFRKQILTSKSKFPEVLRRV